QLASVNLALPHARCAALRPGPCRTPPDQPSAAPGQYAPALCSLAARDPRALSQRLRGRLLRAAPAACRIRCLDRRAQRRAEHLFLYADAVGVCPLRGSPESKV